MASGSPLPAVRPLVRERRDRASVHGIAGGADHRGGDPGARHGLHEREGLPARGRGAEKKGLPVRRRLPGRAEHQSPRGIRQREHARQDPSEPGRRARRDPRAPLDGRARRVHGRTLPMDRAYEGDPTRPPNESFGLTPVVPPKRGTVLPHGIATGRRTRGGTWSNASSTA